MSSEDEDSSTPKSVRSRGNLNSLEEDHSTDSTHPKVTSGCASKSGTRDTPTFRQFASKKRRILDSDSDSDSSASIGIKRKVLRTKDAFEDRTVEDSGVILDGESDINVNISDSGSSSELESDNANSSEVNSSDTSDEDESEDEEASALDPRVPVAADGNNTSAESDASDGQSEKCYICLNKFSGQEIATPETCDHAFCLDCLQEWSKKINTCPVDRKVFKLILVRLELQGRVFRRVPVEDKQEDDVDEGHEDLTYCEVCGRCDREDRLLLCDGCDLGYHCECLEPPLTIIPIEEWFCPQCAQQDEERGMAADLLDEFNDMIRNNFRPRPFGGRGIARTRASENVRARIQNRRTADMHNEDNENDRVVPPIRAPNVRKPRVIRKTKRRYKRRRKTKTKKNSSTSKLQKSSKKVSSGSVRKIKRKRRTTRRKSTKKKRQTKSYRARLASRPLLCPAVRQRIADRLGLSPPRTQQGMPTMRRVQERSLVQHRMDSGIAFSIFGDREELVHFQDLSDEEVNVGDGEMSSVRVQPRGRLLMDPTSRKPRNRTVARVPSPPVSSRTSSFDLIGSILQTQSILHKNSKDVIIQRDGSLKLKAESDATQKRPLNPPCQPEASGNQNNGSAPSTYCANSVASMRDVARTSSARDSEGTNTLSHDDNAMPNRESNFVLFPGNSSCSAQDPRKKTAQKTLNKETRNAQSDDDIDIYSDIETMSNDGENESYPEIDILGDNLKCDMEAPQESESNVERGTGTSDSSDDELVIDEEAAQPAEQEADSEKSDLEMDLPSPSSPHTDNGAAELDQSVSSPIDNDQAQTELNYENSSSSVANDLESSQNEDLQSYSQNEDIQSPSPRGMPSVSPAEIGTSPRDAPSTSSRGETPVYSPRSDQYQSPTGTLSSSHRYALATSPREASPRDTTSISPRDIASSSPREMTSNYLTDATFASPRDLTGTWPRDTASASPRDTASASPRDVASASPRDAGSTSPRDVVSASPRDLASASPRDLASASPRDLASASPRDLASASPRDLASASPRDMASASPRDMASTSPRDLASASPRDVSSASPRDALSASSQDACSPSPITDNNNNAEVFPLVAKSDEKNNSNIRLNKYHQDQDKSDSPKREDDIADKLENIDLQKRQDEEDLEAGDDHEKMEYECSETADDLRKTEDGEDLETVEELNSNQDKPEEEQGFDTKVQSLPDEDDVITARIGSPISESEELAESDKFLHNHNGNASISPNVSFSAPEAEGKESEEENEMEEGELLVDVDKSGGTPEMRTHTNIEGVEDISEDDGSEDSKVQNKDDEDDLDSLVENCDSVENFPLSKDEYENPDLLVSDTHKDATQLPAANEEMQSKGTSVNVEKSRKEVEEEEEDQDDDDDVQVLEEGEQESSESDVLIVDVVDPKTKKADQRMTMSSSKGKTGSQSGKNSSSKSSDSDNNWKKLSKQTRERSYRDGKPKDDKILYRERELKSDFDRKESRRKYDDYSSRRKDDRRRDDSHSRDDKKWGKDKEHYRDKDYSKDHDKRETSKERRSEKDRRYRDKSSDSYEKQKRYSKKDKYSEKEKHSDKEKEKPHSKRSKDESSSKGRDSKRHNKHKDLKQDSRSPDKYLRYDRLVDKKSSDTGTDKFASYEEQYAYEEERMLDLHFKYDDHLQPVEKHKDRDVRKVDDKLIVEKRDTKEKKGKKDAKERKFREEIYQSLEQANKDKDKGKEGSPTSDISDVESKEVFSKGGSIIINVNYNRNKDTHQGKNAKADEVPVGPDIPDSNAKGSGKKKASPGENEWDSEGEEKPTDGEWENKYFTPPQGKTGEVAETHKNKKSRNQTVEERSKSVENKKTSSPGNWVEDDSGNNKENEIDDMLSDEKSDDNVVIHSNSESNAHAACSPSPHISEAVPTADQHGKDSLSFSGLFKRQPRSPSPPSPLDNESYDPCDPTRSPSIKDETEEMTTDSPMHNPRPPPSPELPPLPPEPEPAQPQLQVLQQQQQQQPQPQPQHQHQHQAAQILPPPQALFQTSQAALQPPPMQINFVAQPQQSSSPHTFQANLNAHPSVSLAASLGPPTFLSQSTLGPRSLATMPLVTSGIQGLRWSLNNPHHPHTHHPHGTPMLFPATAGQMQQVIRGNFISPQMAAVSTGLAHHHATGSLGGLLPPPAPSNSLAAMLPQIRHHHHAGSLGLISAGPAGLHGHPTGAAGLSLGPIHQQLGQLPDMSQPPPSLGLQMQSLPRPVATSLPATTRLTQAGPHTLSPMPHPQQAVGVMTPVTSVIVSTVPLVNTVPVTMVTNLVPTAPGASLTVSTALPSAPVNNSKSSLDVVDMDVDSPYSPGDSPLMDGVLDSPDSPPAQENRDDNIPITSGAVTAEGGNDSFDALLASVPKLLNEGKRISDTVKAVKNKSTKADSAGKKSKAEVKSGKGSKKKNHHGKKKGKHGKKEVSVKMNESQLKILDDLPSSAVEMQVKEKFLKKLNRQERVVEEVKLSLKPFYNRRDITKDEYKNILRKCVPKICHNKTGEINPVKIKGMVEGYVKKYRHNRKKYLKAVLDS